jgi:hypothetical protein
MKYFKTIIVIFVCNRCFRTTQFQNQHNYTVVDPDVQFPVQTGKSRKVVNKTAAKEAKIE